jgi:hypothetical protein
MGKINQNSIDFSNICEQDFDWKPSDSLKPPNHEHEDDNPIENLSYLLNSKNNGEHGENFEVNRPNQHGLCRLQPPHTLLVSFQKGSRSKNVTSNAHTFVEWQQYMKALFTSCYLGCLNHMSPHWVPKNKRGWLKIEATDECRMVCQASMLGIKKGIIPRSYRGMSIESLTGVFNAIIIAWPSMIILINSVLTNTIDSITLGHVKEVDFVDSYTIRITYFLVVNTFIMSNDNARTIRLKAFLNKSEYKPSESPLAFASKLQKEQRDINTLYSGPYGGETVISQAMIKETFLDSIRRKTDRFYENILDNIENEHISFSMLVEKINNKYMREKSRVVTESLFSVKGFDNAVHGNNDDSAYYSTSKQVPVKRNGDKSNMSDLPCFQMRDKGTCDYGTGCKFSHDLKSFKKVSSKALFMTELSFQNAYNGLHEKLYSAQQKTQKYKSKYKNQGKRSFSKRKPPIKSPSKPPTVKFFEDVGKSNTHKANLVVDGATPDEHVSDASDKEYTTDRSVESDTSETE